MNFNEIQQYVRSQMGDKRFRHVLGCVESAGLLAVRYGADAEKAKYAALLHDVTKEYDREKQLKICAQWSIILDEDSFAESALLHAITGAVLAQKMFGTDAEITDAIRFHTTGRAQMTLLDKIICLADYIEPNRSFPGVEAIRRKSELSLEEALIEAFTGTAVHTLERGGILHPDTIRARNALIREVSNKD